MKEDLNSHKKNFCLSRIKERCAHRHRAGDRGIRDVAGALETVATSVGGHFSWLLVCQIMLSVL